MSPESLVELLFSRLNEAERHAITLSIREAEARGEPLYLVGGSVRDLLLGRPQLDLDLALEGDALALAQRLAAALGARATLHRRFGTSTVRGAGFSLDLARTRSETYLRPGALPSVRPASVVQDLARRDFTVNAMALALSRSQAGQLLDPHGGCGDLERRSLRVLHDRSFQDDATRILRCLRYEARLGFRPERRTMALLRRGLSYLDTISGTRLRRELLALCGLDGAARALGRARALGVLTAIHPALSWDGRRSRALRRLRGWRLASEEACLCLLAAAHSNDRQGLVDRLALRGAAGRAVLDFGRLAQGAALSQRDPTPSRVAAALTGYSVPALAAFAALAAQPVSGRILWYLRRGRLVRTALDGRDLMALGVPAGPGLGALLTRLLEARLDGLVASRREEVALVRAALRSETDPSSRGAGRPDRKRPSRRPTTAVGA